MGAAHPYYEHRYPDPTPPHRSRARTSGLARAVLLGALLDAQQHLALHDRVRQLDEQHVGHAGDVAMRAGPGQQPAARVVDRGDDVGAPVLDHQRARRVDLGQPGGVAGEERQRVPRLPVLPLLVDLLGASQPAAGEVLQPVVGVEPAAVLPDLHQPAPHPLRGRVHGHRTGDREQRPAGVVTGQPAPALLLGGAPAPEPGPDVPVVDERGDRSEHGEPPGGPSQPARRQPPRPPAEGGQRAQHLEGVQQQRSRDDHPDRPHHRHR